MRSVQVLCALVVVAVCSASPAKYHRVLPRAYMIGAYYSPRYARQGSDVPQVVEDQSPELVAEPESEPQQDNVDEQVPLESETTEGVEVAAAEPSSDPAAEVPAEAASDEEAPAAEDDAPDALAAPAPASWPFGAGGKGTASYNAFFPIFISGNSGRARTRSVDGEEGNSPGSATAIANSFSTGKGGVATSHAVSFSDPSVAAALRNAGLFNAGLDA